MFPAPELIVDHYTVRYMEPFNLNARVIVTNRHTTDQMSDFSPIDVGVAWGPLGEEGKLDLSKFYQKERFLYWKGQKIDDVPYWDVRKHIGHLHVIPADDYVLQELYALQPNDLISFRGHLVRVDNNEGRGIWVSSRSRTDTGAQACEIVYITDLFRY